MAAQRLEDGVAIGLYFRHRLQVFGRKAATEIDHGKRDAAISAIAEHFRGHGKRLVPHVRIALLRSDMERDPMGDQPEAMGMFQHIDRHLRLAAEFAR